MVAYLHLVLFISSYVLCNIPCLSIYERRLLASTIVGDKLQSAAIVLFYSAISNASFFYEGFGNERFCTLDLGQ